MPVEDSRFPIFHQPWWLDAVAPGRWREVVVDNGGELTARLPYVERRRMGMTLLVQPPLTQFLGPWFAEPDGKYVTRLSREHDLAGKLIEQLPQFDLFQQNMSPLVQNTLPFQWAGFETSVRHTYRFDDLTNLDAVWSETRANIRTDVRKAEKRLEVCDNLGLDRFLDLHRMTYARQDLELPYDDDVVRQIDAACEVRNRRRMLFARDESGAVHAAVFLVWDDDVCYYLLSGGDPKLRNSGATALLLWKSIEFASTVCPVFDFEGSMIPPIERFFRAFGARQTPYFTIRKSGRRYRALVGLRDAARIVTRRSH